MMTSVSWPIHMKLETRFLLAAFKRWLAFNWSSIESSSGSALLFNISQFSPEFYRRKQQQSASSCLKAAAQSPLSDQSHDHVSTSKQKWKSGKVELAGSSSPPQHCRLAAPEVVQGRSHCWPRSLPKPRIYNCHHWYQFINIILILVRYHNYSMQTLLFHMQSLCGQQKHKTSPTRAKPSCKSKWWYIGNY